MATRIGIAGVTGRMGLLLAEETRAAGAQLVGGIGRAGSAKPFPAGVEPYPDIAALAAASDVVVDFTNAATAQPHAAALARSGKAWVLGTSGLSAADEAAVAAAAQRIPVVYASNFSPGVNLVLALAERMGAALPADTYDAEIMEMHHRQKVDAPSGTAIGIGPRGRQGPRRRAGRRDRERPARPYRRPRDRRDRLRGAARRPGGGRAHADLRRRRQSTSR